MTEGSAALAMASGLIPNLAGLEIKVDLYAESKPYFKDCQIEATNDIEAVKCWLKRYAHNLNTLSSYERQVKLFLMWCCYEKGKTIGQLKVQDFADYFNFLRNPPQSWCTSRAVLRLGRQSDTWRPLVGGLSESAVKISFRILQSLMNYLKDGYYVRANPLSLIKTNTMNFISQEERKYQVWARMLEEDEWNALQISLDELPESNEAELKSKLRTQFLFGLLYFLGLRIHEVANHTWKAFQFRDGKWWFFVKGKGGKLGHIPVHEKLLMLAKLYRISLDKMPLPEAEESEPFFISVNQKPLQIRQLYNIIKKVGNLASTKFEKNPIKEAKLKKLSPHWLRHLSASHQSKAGVHATMIRENLRHSSSRTTQIYLHAEDDLRHEAMQKMSLKVEPKQLIRKIIKQQTLFLIELTKGPVHKGLGFKKFIECLETNAFGTYQWQPYQFDKSKKIEEIETSIIPIKVIKLAYLFNDLEDIHINSLIKAITFEARVRLFIAEITTKKFSDPGIKEKRYAG